MARMLDSKGLYESTSRLSEISSKATKRQNLFDTKIRIYLKLRAISNKSVSPLSIYSLTRQNLSRYVELRYLEFLAISN